MSKSIFYPNELLVGEYTIKHDKGTDGHKHAVEHILDSDYNKEVFDTLESRNSCEMLKADDRWNNYFWNSAGCYFCNDSLL